MRTLCLMRPCVVLALLAFLALSFPLTNATAVGYFTQVRSAQGASQFAPSGLTNSNFTMMNKWGRVYFGLSEYGGTSVSYFEGQSGLPGRYDIRCRTTRVACDYDVDQANTFGYSVICTPKTHNGMYDVSTNFRSMVTNTNFSTVPGWTAGDNHVCDWSILGSSDSPDSLGGASIGGTPTTASDLHIFNPSALYDFTSLYEYDPDSRGWSLPYSATCLAGESDDDHCSVLLGPSGTLRSASSLAVADQVLGAERPRSRLLNVLHMLNNGTVNDRRMTSSASDRKKTMCTNGTPGTYLGDTAPNTVEAQQRATYVSDTLYTTYGWTMCDFDRCAGFTEYAQGTTPSDVNVSACQPGSRSEYLRGHAFGFNLPDTSKIQNVTLRYVAWMRQYYTYVGSVYASDVRLVAPADTSTTTVSTEALHFSPNRVDRRPSTQTWQSRNGMLTVNNKHGQAGVNSSVADPLNTSDHVYEVDGPWSLSWAADGLDPGQARPTPPTPFDLVQGTRYLTAPTELTTAQISNPNFGAVLAFERTNFDPVGVLNVTNTMTMPQPAQVMVDYMEIEVSVQLTWSVSTLAHTSLGDLRRSAPTAIVDVPLNASNPLLLSVAGTNLVNVQDADIVCRYVSVGTGRQYVVPGRSQSETEVQCVVPPFANVFDTYLVDVSLDSGTTFTTNGLEFRTENFCSINDLDFADPADDGCARGTCNTATGVCACEDGFYGVACSASCSAVFASTNLTEITAQRQTGCTACTSLSPRCTWCAGSQDCAASCEDQDGVPNTLTGYSRDRLCPTLLRSLDNATGLLGDSDPDRTAAGLTGLDLLVTTVDPDLPADWLECLFYWDPSFLPTGDQGSPEYSNETGPVVLSSPVSSITIVSGTCLRACTVRVTCAEVPAWPRAGSYVDELGAANQSFVTEVSLGLAPSVLTAANRERMQADPNNRPRLATGVTTFTFYKQPEVAEPESVNIVAIIAGSAAASIAGVFTVAGAVAGVLYYRKVTSDKYRALLTLPIFHFEVAFQTYYALTAQHSAWIRAYQERLDGLAQLLFEPDNNWVLLDAVAFCFTSSDCEDYMRALVYLASSFGTSTAMVQHFIDHEVELKASINQVETLFRGFQPASRSWTALAQLTPCLHYLHRTLALPLYEVCHRRDTDEISFAGDAQNAEPGSENATDQVRKYALLASATHIVQPLLESVPFLPRHMREILAHLGERIREHFPDFVVRSIGAFFVLRLFSPIIAAPETYGLLVEAPDDETRALLVQIARILQVLANDATPKLTKDPIQQALFSFLKQNRDDFRAAMLELSEPLPPEDEFSDETDDVGQFDLSPNVLSMSWLLLHHSMVEYKEAILANLNKTDAGSNLVDEFVALLEDLGEAVPLGVVEDDLGL